MRRRGKGSSFRSGKRRKHLLLINVKSDPTPVAEGGVVGDVLYLFVEEKGRILLPLSRGGKGGKKRPTITYLLFLLPHRESEGKGLEERTLHLHLDHAFVRGEGRAKFRSFPVSVVSKRKITALL